MLDRAIERAQVQNRLMRPKELSKIGLFKKRAAAFTLAEVTMCIAVTGIIFIGILVGYVQSTRNAERAEHSVVVFRLVIKQPETTQVARREPLNLAVADEVLQLPTLTNPDLPVSGAD